MLQGVGDGRAPVLHHVTGAVPVPAWMSATICNASSERGVVIGEHDLVCKTRCCRAHQRPLATVAVHAATNTTVRRPVQCRRNTCSACCSAYGVWA